jgi:exonuclease III
MIENEVLQKFKTEIQEQPTQKGITIDYAHKSKELAELYEGLSVQKKCRTTLACPVHLEPF